MKLEESDNNDPLKNPFYAFAIDNLETCLILLKNKPGEHEYILALTLLSTTLTFLENKRNLDNET